MNLLLRITQKKKERDESRRQIMRIELTETGARLMALGAWRPSIRTRYER